MTTRVKICGINDPEAFDTAVEAGADWLGFVFFPPSPRAVTAAQAAALSGRVSGRPLRVGLFVDPTDALIGSILDAVALDILQVYGSGIDPARLRNRFGLPVWRPVGIAEQSDLPASSLGADALLLEARPPEDATRPGGNAVSFDWSMLNGWRAPAPWLLAGGLTPDNVATAIRLSGAAAVDVSSGVETEKGRKDPALIRAFVERARRGAAS